MFESDVRMEEASDRLASGLAAILGEGPLPEDPAGLEMLAATLLVPLLQPDLPTDVPAALIAEIERHGDAGAAGLLTATAVVAGDPIAAQARAASERLARDGIVSPAAERLGTLALREAVQIEGGDAELLVALLGRPRQRTVQVAVLGIEMEDSGGALVECMLTPPMPTAEGRALLYGHEHGPDPCHPIDAAQLTRRVRAAAQRTVELGGALSCEAATALPLIARALTGDPEGFARPQILPPWEDDDDELIVDAAEEEDGLEELMRMLLDEFEAYARRAHEPDSCAWRNGDFVASCMLQWKGGYDDGRLGRWTVDDLAEFLLDYFPRKVTIESEALDDVPDCALAFLRFLDDRGSLSGAPIEHLAEACDELREEFREQADSPERWGMAKSMAMQMLAEGVDPEQPGATDAWIAEFNSRPRDARDAIVGGAADRMLAAAARQEEPPAEARPGPDRRRERKAQRSARKRNRKRR